SLQGVVGAALKVQLPTGHLGIKQLLGIFNGEALAVLSIGPVFAVPWDGDRFNCRINGLLCFTAHISKRFIQYGAHILQSYARTVFAILAVAPIFAVLRRGDSLYSLINPRLHLLHVAVFAITPRLAVLPVFWSGQFGKLFSQVGNFSLQRLNGLAYRLAHSLAEQFRVKRHGQAP